MTARDREIAAAVSDRLGLVGAGQPEWQPQVLNLQTRRLGLAEVHWVFELGAFVNGGAFWPEPPAKLAGFVDDIRRHSFEVFYREICPQYGIPAHPDSLCDDQHVLWPFALDLAAWAICPLDEPLYQAKRKHSAFLERWFAAFPVPHPSTRMIEVLTRNLCRYSKLPYPGPFELRQEPIYPSPEPAPVPYHVRRSRRRNDAGPSGESSQPKPRIIRGDGFLASVNEVRSAKPGPDAVPALTFWWLGQSGFLIHWEGRFILLDPWLSAPGGGGQRSGQRDPGTRLPGRLVAPDELDFIDLVVVGHHEPDHLDPATLRTLGRVNPKLVLVCPAPLRALARDRSRLPEGRIVSIDPRPHRSPGYSMWRPTRGRVQGFGFIPVVAERGPDLPTVRGPGPMPMGFIIEKGDVAVYHGSHAWLSGQAVMELSTWQISVALLPVGGRLDHDDPSGNYWGDEAALLAKDLAAQVVIPCHYDPFEAGMVTTEEFEAACIRLGQPFHIPTLGEGLTLPVYS